MGKAKNLLLSETAALLLESVGNQSAYVERLLEQRTREWQEALAVLQTQGWTCPEVAAACDALNGAWEMLGSRPPQWLAAELADAQGLIEKWDLQADRWKERIKAVHTSYEIAWAIRTAARECWSSNKAFDAALERMGRRGA